MSSLISDMELLLSTKCGYPQTNGEDSYTAPDQESAVQPLAAASVGRTASAPPGPVERMAPASPFASQSVSPIFPQISQSSLAECGRSALLMRVAL